MAEFEVGENRAPKYGVPVWAGEWPVIVDGQEKAVIIETERGYRLREGGAWAERERSCRSSVEDDARNRYLTWVTQNGHPASGTRYQEAAYNDGKTWARVQVGEEIVFGPTFNTEGAYAEYTRRYADYVNKIEEKNT